MVELGVVWVHRTETRSKCPPDSESTIKQPSVSVGAVMGIDSHFYRSFPPKMINSSVSLSSHAPPPSWDWTSGLVLPQSTKFESTGGRTLRSASWVLGYLEEKELKLRVWARPKLGQHQRKRRLQTSAPTGHDVGGHVSVLGLCSVSPSAPSSFISVTTENLLLDTTEYPTNHPTNDPSIH